MSFNSFIDIGAWQHVEESRTTPIEEMQVWDGVSDSRIHFSGRKSTETNVTEMARLTENLNLQRALLRQIDNSATSGILTLMDETKVQSINSDGESGHSPQGPHNTGWPLLQLSNSRSIRARLLVGADGPSSPVRAYSKIDSFGWSYNMRAVVATLQHEAPLNSFGLQRTHTTAYQRFLPTGPVAFLPLSPTRASLVWSTTPELAQALVESGGKVLARLINAAFRLPDLSMKYLHTFLLDKWQESKRSPKDSAWVTEEEIVEEIRWRERSHSIDAGSPLSSISMSDELSIPSPDADMYPPLIHSVQPRSAASFPLRMNHADTYLGSRTALVGDAAHTVHPLAGQGLNLGIADAQSLAQTIQSASDLGLDVGSPTALQAYPRERYLANHAMLSGVDKLAKLYGTSFGPVVWMRSVGLDVVNEWDGLKDMFMGVAGAGDKGLQTDLIRRGETKQFRSVGAQEGDRQSSHWPNILATAVEGIGDAFDGARTLLGAGMRNGRR
ncbi:457_t:CDS:1 [Acaulospora colombiana]|uniref:457_t:CDS:1 n=1 Tax=Acaulospora colombiana TaxID=27376 RepID=A0ACA9PKI2_9GLOM|nr:457_t:CDS:1 [Acaulospora colombiana]